MLFGEFGDDLAEDVEAFVDVDTFFSLLSSSPRQTLPLTPCQVHQLKLTHSNPLLTNYLRLYRNAEDRVRSTGQFVQVMRALDPVLGAEFKEFEYFSGTGYFE